MALPLLVGLGVRTVASYTMKYGIPAAKEAYKAYLKKNPAMKKKMKETMTDFFKKPSIVSAGNKFKNVKKTTKTRKTNTPRTNKKTTDKKTTTDTRTRSQKAFDKGAKMTQEERNKSVRKVVGTAIGVGAGAGAVYEVAKGIRASSEAKAEAARKAKLAKEKADADKKRAEKKKQRDSQTMNQANPKVRTSVSGSGFTAKRDKPVMGSKANVSAGTGRGTTTFKKDDDKKAVRSRSGKKVKSRFGIVRTGR